MMCNDNNRTGKGAVHIKELNIEAIIDNLEMVLRNAEEELQRIRCPIKTIKQIKAAIDEIFGNIAHYAYGERIGNATVRMEIDAEKSSVSISFIDQGMPFNPLKLNAPDVTLTAKERRKGGLGIFLVKKMMDDVSYEYKDGKNIFTIKKGW